MSHTSLTWKEAIRKSPGPQNLKESVLLFIKGLFIGTANIIPGVSGGTIALISGIYISFLEAVNSVNSIFLKKILSLKFKEAVSVIHIRFLFSIFLGTGLAVISLAHIANYCLNYYPVYTAAFFTGLILASTILIGKKINSWFGLGGIALIMGITMAYYIVGMIPVSTPETWWFVFLSGVISISAMILPGLSGAFILLILGKYSYIIGALKNPFNIDNILIIIIFILGCAIGITGFSRMLHFLLKKYYNITLAVLTGLMLGSMRKIWPWKEVMETKMIHGKLKVISERNILPDKFDETLLIACGLCLTGFILIYGMKKLSGKTK